MEGQSKVKMERYTIIVNSPGAETFRILVPFPPTSSISALATEVGRRVSQLEVLPEKFNLHLGDADGPLLDSADAIGDVIHDPKIETITATYSPRNAQLKKFSRNGPQSNGLGSSTTDFKIRVVTPVLARAHKDLHTISTLRGQITRNTTIRELRVQIAKHLCVEVSDAVQTYDECNCSFARRINEEASMNEPRSGLSGEVENPLRKFIVVQGTNNVQILAVEATDQASMRNQVYLNFGDISNSKEITFIGGVLASNSTTHYTKLPVLAICSQARHSHSGSQPRDGEDTCLDLHTSECPIEISTLNADLSLDELCLKDLAINGVVDIYVVQRKNSAAETARESGKDAIFLDGAAWEHPVAQSLRGMAMLLSTLRVFSEIASAKHMDQPSQDSILHVFNLLTRFPPAVRAVHTLMNGKSPLPSERAALFQALYEVLKDIIPDYLVKSDVRRYMEGSRLLLGLILEKAKHLKLKEDATLPYFSSLEVIDLRNTFTMEAIAYPIQTPFGLVEQGYYEACQEGGILVWKTGESPLSVIDLSNRANRITLLCGGVIPQVTVFDMNSLNSTSEEGYIDQGDADRAISPRELSDLNHQSTLCSRNKLAVLPPASLPSADAPALTLDRNGLLAVYVGRAPCSQPGKDITIFRPTHGGEETIDVSIITQLLVPVLEFREADGTIIFDSFGDGSRRFKAPNEILMVVVDCSHSMSENSDFVELRPESEENENGEEDDNEDFNLQDDAMEADTSADGSTFYMATLDEMKSSITDHESFTDMISMVYDAPSYSRRPIAAKVLQLLTHLATYELSARLGNLEKLKGAYTDAWYQAQVRAAEPYTTKLKTSIAGLDAHKQALCDFLIYRAENSLFLDKPWVWNTGDEIPRISKPTPGSPSDRVPAEEFSIPPEFRCPISQEALENPVITCDGFTFERNNIERWFQVRKSSPLTGLVLENTDLRANGEIAVQVQSWIAGTDLIEINPTAFLSRNRTRSRSLYSTVMNPNLITVEFFSRLGAFKRQVSLTISVVTLYKLAFRGMKGRHSKFQLHCKNVFLAPSTEPLSSTNIQNRSLVHIHVPDEAPPTSSENSENSDASTLEELCLLKVYTHKEQMLFSYWVPKTTTNTLASVIIRYWRHQIKQSHPHINITDMIPWTDMVDEGDRHMVGQPQDHWSQLSTYLTLYRANGSLKKENLCGKIDPEEEDGMEVDNQMAGTNHHPLVLRVYLGGKPAAKAKKTGNNLTRLDVLKSMFDAFVNRLLAYNFQTHMGLITFESTAKVSQKITHAVENFRHKVNGMKAHGDTALWDALALASDQIIDYGKKFPNAKKRIIVLSDGNDNMSKKRHSDVSFFLSQNNIVVDSFCLGDEPNIDLRTISYLSGGYKFSPKSLEQAMAICEMEPVLSILERPQIVLPKEAHSHLYDPYLRFAFAKDKAVPEIVTADIIPMRKEHPNVDDHFVMISSMAGRSSGSGSGSGSVNTHSDSNLRTSRILTEIRNTLANPHPHYDVYLSDSNMSFWKVIMQGPPGSAYESGTFVLYIDMEEDYPAFPPKCRFITPIYHPNINRHGRVCHSILDRNWASDTTNLQLINTIYSLLLVPEFSDPINAVVTLNFHWDEVAFKNETEAHIQKHAIKTRAEWKKEILEE